MKKLKARVIFELIMILCLVLSLTTGSFANQISNDISRNRQIEELFDLKAKLLSNDNVDTNRLNDIDKQLEQLGVEKLTQSEVQKRFPSAKIALVKSNEYPVDTVIPQVVAPSKDNVSWSTYRVLGLYNGKYYEVQKLIAQPNTRPSCLKFTGARIITKNLNGAAGVINVVKLIAGEIPIYGRWISFFDAVSGTVSAISRQTTIVGNIQVTHTWSMVTTISYQYVKEEGKPDSTQNLTFVSSRLTGESGWEIPGFAYNNGTVYPNLIQGRESYQVIPANYDNTDLAIRGFVNTGAINTSAVVGYVNLIGLNESDITTIYPTVPIFPDQIS